MSEILSIFLYSLKRERKSVLYVSGLLPEFCMICGKNAKFQNARFFKAISIYPKRWQALGNNSIS